MSKVVVSLYHHNAEIEYVEVSPAEAKALLAKQMNTGWEYRLPAWQTNEDGSGESRERLAEIRRLVEASA